MSGHMKKRDLVVFWFIVVQMLMHRPLFGLQTCIFGLKLPQGLFYMSADSKGSGSAVSPEPLLIAYVISALFPCVSSYLER